MSFTTNTPSSPSATTGSASNVSYYTATLDGTVNANGFSTTTWFQYGTTSGSYSNTSSTQSVSGTSDTTVSIDISGLSGGTTYYYRIAAQNSAGTTYGSEMSTTNTQARLPDNWLCLQRVILYGNIEWDSQRKRAQQRHGFNTALPAAHTAIHLPHRV